MATKEKNTVTMSRFKWKRLVDDLIALSGLLEAILESYVSVGTLNVGALTYLQGLADKTAQTMLDLDEDGPYEELPF